MHRRPGFGLSWPPRKLGQPYAPMVGDRLFLGVEVGDLVDRREAKHLSIMGSVTGDESEIRAESRGCGPPSRQDIRRTRATIRADKGRVVSTGERGPQCRNEGVFAYD